MNYLLYFLAELTGSDSVFSRFCHTKRTNSIILNKLLPNLACINQTIRVEIGSQSRQLECCQWSHKHDFYQFDLLKFRIRIIPIFLLRVDLGNLVTDSPY